MEPVFFFKKSLVHSRRFDFSLDVAEKKNERGLTGLTQMIHSSEQQLGSSSGLVYEFQIMISTAAAAAEE